MCLCARTWPFSNVRPNLNELRRPALPPRAAVCFVNWKCLVSPTHGVLVENRWCLRDGIPAFTVRVCCTCTRNVHERILLFRVCIEFESFRQQFRARINQFRDSIGRNDTRPRRFLFRSRAPIKRPPARSNAIYSFPSRLHVFRVRRCCRRRRSYDNRSNDT